MFSILSTHEKNGTVMACISYIIKITFIFSLYSTLWLTSVSNVTCLQDLTAFKHWNLIAVLSNSLYKLSVPLVHI